MTFRTSANLDLNGPFFEVMLTELPSILQTQIIPLLRQLLSENLVKCYLDGFSALALAMSAMNFSTIWCASASVYWTGGDFMK